jgi:hypothetical protein
MAPIRFWAIGAAVGFVVLLAVAMATRPSSAKALDPALQGQLLQLFDGFNNAIRAEKVDDSVAMRSSETRKSMQDYLASADQRKELVQIVSDSIPDTIEVKHSTLSKDGTEATVLVIARKKIPADAPVQGGPPPGSVVTVELTLNFLKGNGSRKFVDQIFGMAPTQIVACKNEAFEPIDAYDRSKNTSLDGPIARVAFEANYTLVIVRVVNKENCAYLPNRATIQKAGLDPDLLVPYAIVEIDGFPHKRDKQKAWADHITTDDE